MKVETMGRLFVGGILLAVAIWIGTIWYISGYIKSGEFQKDITNAGITTKQIIKDIKEAE